MKKVSASFKNKEAAEKYKACYKQNHEFITKLAEVSRYHVDNVHHAKFILVRENDYGDWKFEDEELNAIAVHHNIVAFNTFEFNNYLKVLWDFGDGDEVIASPDEPVKTDMSVFESLPVGAEFIFDLGTGEIWRKVDERNIAKVHDINPFVEGCTIQYILIKPEDYNK